MNDRATCCKHLMAVLKAGLLTILLLLVSMSNPARGEEIPGLILPEDVYYFVDESGQVTLEEVLLREDQQKLLSNELHNFGQDQRPYWYRIPLRNTNDTMLHLVASFPSISRNTQAYIRDIYPDGDEQIMEVPLMKGAHRLVRYAFDLLPESRAELLVRVKADENQSYQIAINTPEVLMDKEVAYRSLHILYYGAAWIIVAYNFMVFFSLRDKVYLFYSLIVLFLSLYLFAMEGFGVEFLWPQLSEHNHVFISVVALAQPIFIVLFGMTLFGTKKSMPLVHRMLKFLGISLALDLAMLPFVPFVVFGSIAGLLAMILPWIMLTTGIVGAKRGHASAKYFIMGWIGMFSCSILIGAAHFGAGSYVGAIHLYKLVSLWEFGFFALAVAGRIKRMREERQASQEALLKLQANQKEQLEELVTIRTAELRTEQERNLQSIEYAKQIQKSLLPELHEGAPCSFYYLWEPKDVVSGDLILFEKTDKGFFWIVMDCTGHGVPAAFMTMVATSALRQILPIANPEDLGASLRMLSLMIQQTLYSKEGNISHNNGLELGICYVDHERREAHYVGSKISLFVSKDGELTEYPGDRQSVGFLDSDVNFQFTNHRIPLSGDQQFFMYSDGITDLPMGEKQYPLGKKKLKSLLGELCLLPFEEQEGQVRKIIEASPKDSSRRDDIAILSFQF